MKICVYKSRRLLICLNGECELFRTNVQLGFAANDGPKLCEGDGRTPEGEYVISSKNPESRFFRSLGISYPSPADARNGLESGLIDAATYERICRDPSRPPWDTPLGGFIMIHGQKSPPAEGDWTAGCIALENDIMQRLFNIAAIGNTVIIYP